jgi:hypothetical protein
MIEANIIGPSEERLVVDAELARRGSPPDLCDTLERALLERVRVDAVAPNPSSGASLTSGDPSSRAARSELLIPASAGPEAPQVQLKNEKKGSGCKSELGSPAVLSSNQ